MLDNSSRRGDRRAERSCWAFCCCVVKKVVWKKKCYKKTVLIQWGFKEKMMTLIGGRILLRVNQSVPPWICWIWWSRRRRCVKNSDPTTTSDTISLWVECMCVCVCVCVREKSVIGIARAQRSGFLESQANLSVERREKCGVKEFYL